MGEMGLMAVEAIYVPDLDAEGRVCGIYVMGLDVTERTLAQQESKRLQEELFHAGRISTMGELAGALAHEINQPLGAIMSNAQAAQRFLAAPQPDLAEVQAILFDIVEDDARAGEVIRRLRELLKHQGTRRQALDLNALLGEVAQMLHSDAVRRGVDVRMELAPQLPPIQGDRIQLQQVALNLMLNAFEAMEARPRGDRRLVVRTAERGDDVLTAVSDSGPGIPKGDMDRIFKPFYTTKPQGLGMGLSLSRSIVQAHKGRLWAESPPGGGTTFCFSLPIEAGHTPA
jgi:two-component system sensor kinase FixL